VDLTFEDVIVLWKCGSWM